MVALQMLPSQPIPENRETLSHRRKVLQRGSSVGDIAMRQVYDIFRELGDGTVRWIEAAENFDRARARIQELASRSAGSYFIFDHEKQAKAAEVKSKAAGKPV